MNNIRNNDPWNTGNNEKLKQNITINNFWGAMTFNFFFLSYFAYCVLFFHR